MPPSLRNIRKRYKIEIDTVARLFSEGISVKGGGHCIYFQYILRVDVWRRGDGELQFCSYIKNLQYFLNLCDFFFFLLHYKSMNAFVTKYFRAHLVLSESFRVEQQN